MNENEIKVPQTIAELKRMGIKVLIIKGLIRAIPVLLVVFFPIYGFLMSNIFSQNAINIKPFLMGYAGIVVITAVISKRLAEKGKRMDAYTKGYENLFLIKPLKENFENVTHERNEGIRESEISGTGMFYTGEVFASNDLITGEYEGVKFRQSDVSMKVYRKGSDGKRRLVPIFEGRWIILDFGKKISQSMRVQSKLGAWVNLFGKQCERVKTESQDFNDEYFIVAENPEEAFYILTPHFMERIRKLGYSVDGKLVLIFQDNILHIGIDNRKDAFEPFRWLRYGEEREKEAIEKEIELIKQGTELGKIQRR